MRGGGFGGRGRGGAAYSGSSTPRHVVGLSEGAFNPLLVPVKFVRATGSGLGTVGGEDEHGLELAGAASPPRPQEKRLPRHSVEGALAAEVQNLALEADEDDVEDNPKGGPPPETAFEPEPATTATMALDELEDAPDAAEPTTHPGLGSRARQPVEREVPAPPPTAALPEATPDVDEDVAGGDDGPPLFEISVSRSTVTVDLPSSLAPPAALVAHDSSTPLSSDSSDSDSEQILFPRRAQAHADPVSSARPPAAAPRPAADLSLSTSSSHAPAVAARTRAPRPSQPAQPAKQSKKALKRASRAARKTGRLHARSGNAHLAGHESGRRLDEDEDEDENQGVAQEQAQDRAAGAALFAQMQGAEGVDDMLVASDDDDEQDVIDAEGHVPGQPRQGDSDLEWGSSSPPARGPPRGRAKKAALRAQRADQRERDKLERLVAAGATREEVEVALALEMSLEAERRDARERERRRAEEDYAANVRNDEGDDSMAVLAAFARGAVGQLGGTHERGDDADRRMAEDEEDEDEWGTSSDGESEDEEESEEEDDDDTEGAHDRRLALEEEEGSDEVDSDDELEMEYSLGDADGRCVYSLSRDSSSRCDDLSAAAASSTPCRSPPPTRTRSTRPSRPQPTPTPSSSPSRARSWRGRRSRCSAWGSRARADARTSASARRRARGSARARARRMWSKAAAARRTATTTTATTSCSRARIRGLTATRTTSPRCRCACSPLCLSPFVRLCSHQSYVFAGRRSPQYRPPVNRTRRSRRASLKPP